MQIVAPGGVGKTQLVKKWQEGLLDRDDHGGAVRAFDWSFYSQGTKQQASADDFFDKALRWFGEAEPENYKDPWAKGERLAELVKQRRTLLILDGMEPLQHPPGPMAGELTDPSIQALLEGLQRDNPGLCIVTTREAVPTLNEMNESKRRTIDLGTLSPEAGAELLKIYGVTGDPEELRQASVDVEGHALALILLGTYLELKCQGDVAQRTEALLFQGHERYAAHAHKVMASYETWFEREDDIGRAAVAILRLMGLFNRPADAGCLGALRAEPPIPGLTDALFASKRKQESPGDSGDAVYERDDELWERAVQRLRAARLLADEYSGVPEGRSVIAPVASPGFADNSETPIPGGPTQDDGATPTGFGNVSDAQSPGSRPGLKPIAATRLHPTRHTGDDPLDAHPFVREHFAAQLAERLPDPAREAHRRLYEHLKQSAPELPDNLNDMMPLYHAVEHGCKAGLNEDALHDVYQKRIQRGNEYFSKRQIGAFGAELSTVSNFFKSPFSELRKGFSLRWQSYLLNDAGFGLLAMGRSLDARQTMGAGVAVDVEGGDWLNAAIDSSNLSELSLTLCDVSSAVRRGEQSVELADRSGNAHWRMGTRTTLGDALHASGRGLAGCRSHEAALAAFREAEALLETMLPQYPLLWALYGFKLCDLLLLPVETQLCAEELRVSTLKCKCLDTIRAVRERAEKSRRSADHAYRDDMFNAALDHLTLGRTYVLETRKMRLETRKKKQDIEEEVSALDSAEHHLNESVSLLRQSGRQHELPRGLLQCAALWRVKYEITRDKSQIELAERDLTEAERIAKRGSMLIFRIEAALERTRLALVLGNKKQAKEKLDETRELIRQTEKPYVPHRPDWADWDPPGYIGVFKEGDIVGYHRRNPEIEALQQAID